MRGGALAPFRLAFGLFLSRIRFQLIQPLGTLAVAGRHQACAVDVPSIAMPLRGQPQQQSNQLITPGDRPGLGQPARDVRPVRRGVKTAGTVLVRAAVIGGQCLTAEPRREDGARHPDPVALALRPELSNRHRRLCLQRFLQTRPGDAGVFVLQLRQREAGLEEAIIASRPACIAARMSQGLEPVIQRGEPPADRREQTYQPGTLARL